MMTIDTHGAGPPIQVSAGPVTVCHTLVSLIKEAFDTATETGLTPQQLREQRDELLAALKAIVVSDQDYGFYFSPYVQAKARAALAKLGER